MHSDILDLLYQKYYKDAYIYTLSLCKNKVTAEDIVSDAFIKAFITMNKDENRFKFWLLIVCRNLWIDKVRKEKHLSYNEPDIDIYSQVNTEMQLINKERNQILYNCIMSLQKNYSEILILHYYLNLSLYDIAKIMNLTENNTRILIYRARNKLKSKLEEIEYEF
jgi:RNA polymerase sigma-70 factor (ECF subfamily)